LGRFLFALLMALSTPLHAAERVALQLPWDHRVQFTLAGLGALLLAGLAASAWLLARRQRDTARRANERLLASMAANFPGVLFRRRIWPDGRIDYDFMSAGAAALFGAQPDEWRGATSVAELSQRVLPEDRAEWLKAMERSTRELAPLDVECRVRTRDGGFRWLRTIARGWREGVAATFDGVVFDVTDRRLAEERMREAERRLAEVAANFPGAIYRRRLRADGALEYLSMSDGIVGLTGAPADAYLKMRSLEDMAAVIVAEDMPLWREANDRSARTLEPVDLTIRVRTPEGAIRWIRTHSRAGREADGAVTWDGVVLDVSEAKRLEDALRGSERRFRALADAMPQIVWARDPDGAAVYFNARWREFTGFDDSQSLGWGWLDALHPDDREPALAAWRRARAAKEPYEAEMRYRRRDGAWRWFLVRAAPVADDGEAARWYGAATDIEEIKRTERRQALLMAELDHRVKNTLAAVQSIAQRTLSASGEAERFAGRLGALANTHSLIAHGRWEGALLGDIVEAELAPYRAGGEARALVSGDEVMLAPRAAQTLGLALHELATNAAKYGALSTPTGRVEVTWRLGANGSGRKLSLSWRERGGPPAAPPERRGFGLLLIERSITYEIGGGAQIAFAPEGLECGIDVGEEALADAPVTERAGAAPSTASG